MVRQATALVVIALATTGCASVGAMGRTAVQGNAAVVTQIADYARQLPVGSRVRVDRATGRSIHGTLLSVGADAVVVQRATRIPEPPVSVPLDDVTRIQIEQRSNLGKAIIIGAATGAAATLGMFLLLAIAFAD